MYSELKKSQITDWWVAKSNSKMAFVNILSGEPLSEDLLVVGYLDRVKRELGKSTNRVVKVTKDGVITEKGTFYPFEEAHDLYLHFLIEVQKKHTLVATNWGYAKKISKRTIIADIISNGNVEEGVTFDFIPNKKSKIMCDGYSTKLSSNIVLTTFARRNNCILIEIPEDVKSDIWRSSLALEEDTMEKVRLVQNIFAKRFE